MKIYDLRSTIYDLRLSSGKNFFLVYLFSFFISLNGFAQHTLLLNEDAFPYLDFCTNNLRIHSSIKPMLDVDLNGKTFRILDSSKVIASADVSSKHDYYSEYSLDYPRLSFKEFYSKEKETPTHDQTTIPIKRKAAFLIRPIYGLDGGYDFAGNKLLFSAVGGAIIDADWKNKIGMELRFAAGNSAHPDYLDSVQEFSGVTPGWGDRAYKNSNGTYSFQHLSGNLIWRPSKIFNLQIGRDKHFWGDGYRSLFLSDVSAAMPYIKQTTTIWKFQYVSLFTWMQDYSHADGFKKDFRNKFGTFHYISFNAAKWLNIGVFEAVIWQGNDPNRNRGFDPNYLNPIIFFRPVEYSLGSSDNAMLGASFKIRLNRNNLFYSQILLDEFFLKEILARNGWWANKQGYQLGYKCSNFAYVKDLFLQMELNVVRPYTYSHGSSQQSYSNAGMPLAHPLGANFAEFLGIVSYKKNELTLTGKFVEARYGLDTAGKDYGQNIFISYMDRSAVDPSDPYDHDYHHKIFDGLTTNMFYVEFCAAYELKTAFPIRLELLTAVRREHNVLMTKNTAYLQVGLSLPLWRNYRDY